MTNKKRDGILIYVFRTEESTLKTEQQTNLKPFNFERKLRKRIQKQKNTQKRKQSKKKLI